MRVSPPASASVPPARQPRRGGMFRLGAVLLLLGGLLLAAGCGRGEPRVVRLAVALPTAAHFGQSLLEMVEMALRDAGYQAGPYRVELVTFNTYDEQQSPSLSPGLELQAAQRAIADPSVLVYLGGLSSGQAKQVLPVLNHAGLVMLSPAATWPGLTKNGFGAGEPGVYYPTGRRHFFRVVPADDLQAVAAAQWARELGVRSVFLISTGYTHGEGVIGIFEEAARDLGIEIAGSRVLHWREEPQALQEAVVQLAAEVAAARPDLVYYGGGSGAPTPALIRELRRHGDIPILGADSLLSPSLVTDLGPQLATGLRATHVLPPTERSEQARDFVERYRQLKGREPHDSMLCIYQATRVALMAIARARQPTREAVLAAMGDLGEISGVLGTWQFTPEGDTTLEAVGGFQVVDGKWTFLKALSSTLP